MREADLFRFIYLFSRVPAALISIIAERETQRQTLANIEVGLSKKHRGQIVQETRQETVNSTHVLFAQRKGNKISSRWSLYADGQLSEKCSLAVFSQIGSYNESGIGQEVFQTPPRSGFLLRFFIFHLPSVSRVRPRPTFTRKGENKHGIK